MGDRVEVVHYVPVDTGVRWELMSAKRRHRMRGRWRYEDWLEREMEVTTWLSIWYTARMLALRASICTQMSSKRPRESGSSDLPKRVSASISISWRLKYLAIEVSDLQLVERTFALGLTAA